MRRSLRAQLPPPNALVTYEAAARLLNFTAAAAELGVTQGAVSRQIHILESYLGVVLFQRTPTGVQLTENGLDLHNIISPSLRQIAQKCGEFRQITNTKLVTVSSTNGIATCWLMPRIASFQNNRPDITFRLLTSEHIVMPGEDGVDVAIRYGDGVWPGYVADRLFGDEIFPVCSPAYAAQRKLERPADLLSATLLHKDEIYTHRWGNWEVWLGETGASVSGPLGGPRFNNYSITLQAAIEGRGVALGWGHLVADMLAAGQLVRVGEESLAPGDSYYVVTAHGIQLSRATAQFRDWILHDAELSADKPIGRPELQRFVR